eukprot:g31287.t1
MATATDPLMTKVYREMAINKQSTMGGEGEEHHQQPPHNMETPDSLRAPMKPSIQVVRTRGQPTYHSSKQLEAATLCPLSDSELGPTDSIPTLTTPEQGNPNPTRPQPSREEQDSSEQRVSNSLPTPWGCRESSSDNSCGRLVLGMVGGNDSRSSSLGILLRGGNFPITKVQEAVGSCLFVADVTDMNIPLRVIDVYAPVVQSEELAILQQLPLLLATSRPVILVRDFNCIIDMMGVNVMEDLKEVKSQQASLFASEASKMIFRSRVCTMEQNETCS